jgi:hypothetical protein
LLNVCWKSERVLKRELGSIFEKNCIFLKAVESFTVDTPMSSKFIKFIKFELSLGVKITWAGTDDKFWSLLLWWNFHNVLDFNELELVLKYFSEFPTTAEYEGLTL